MNAESINDIQAELKLQQVNRIEKLIETAGGSSIRIVGEIICDLFVGVSLWYLFYLSLENLILSIILACMATALLFALSILWRMTVSSHQRLDAIFQLLNVEEIRKSALHSIHSAQKPSDCSESQ